VKYVVKIEDDIVHVDPTNSGLDGKSDNIEGLAPAAIELSKNDNVTVIVRSRALRERIYQGSEE